MKEDEIRVLRDIEQFYSTQVLPCVDTLHYTSYLLVCVRALQAYTAARQIDEMPMNVSELI